MEDIIIQRPPAGRYCRVTSDLIRRFMTHHRARKNRVPTHHLRILDGLTAATVFIRTLFTNCLTYLATYVLTPRSRVLPKKLTGSKLVKKSLHFMAPEVSLPRLQEHATYP
jgi:hypothetical protein